MIISIASGKGGTGKTTVATNLAVTIGNSVQLLDCDVEEPNAHLFIRPEIYKREPVALPVPEINTNKCTYCGKCSDLCQFKAIAVIPDTTILTFPELCHSCGGCWEVCPENAVTQAKRELGFIEFGNRGNLEFIHGRLNVGEAMAPPLIKKVRSHADPDKLTIIDAPPGTSCPVIESMRDTDFVLLVTEPTPFGLNDLALAVETMRELRLPFGVVINRADVGDGRVADYCAAQQIPVLLEIPDDRRIAEAYSRGDLAVEAVPECVEAFERLCARIELSLVEELSAADKD